MIVSIGLAIVLRYVVLYQFGDRRRPTRTTPCRPTPCSTIGPVDVIAEGRVAIIVISTRVLIGVASLLRYTKLGKAMRAVSDNPDLAASTGIDVNRTITLVWFMAGVLVDARRRSSRGSPNRSSG